MLNIALVVMGLIALSRLPVRDLPDVDSPIISVTTVYPGAGPEVVESEVTELIEEELNTIEGIRTLFSTSRDEVSAITIEFVLNRDVDVAAQDVRDKIARISGRLPSDADPPIVSKQDADAQPIIWVALYSESYSAVELTDLAENVMKDRLQNISGVGRVIIGGEQRFAVRVRLNADLLAAHQLTVQDVSAALNTENVELPSGRIEGPSREFSIRTQGEFKSAEGFRSLIVAYRNGSPVRLGDVAVVENGVENERTLARYNSKPCLGLGIVKQSKANTVEVAKRTEEVVAECRGILPPGVEAELAYDSSIYIQQSIVEVYRTLFLAVILVTLVIFVFLRSVRTTIIPVIAIPVSLITTFAVVHFLGFTINNLTLLALVLAIGIVVDDAIVVLENSYRHINELGKKPMLAAKEATNEIAFAVIATTLSLVAVFVPVAFMEGSTGRLFYELAMTVAVAVCTSSFVALTLTPMLCSRFLRESATHKFKIYYAFESFFDWLSRVYKRGLDRALHHRVMTIFIGIIAVVLIAVFFRLCRQEFLPMEDKAGILVIAMAPEGSTLDYTDGYVRQIEGMVRQVPEVEGYFCAIGLAEEGVGETDTAFMFVRLKRWDQRTVSQSEVVGSLAGPMFMIPGVLAFPLEPPPLDTGTWGQSVRYIVQSTDLDRLAEYADIMVGRMRQMPIFNNVDSNLKINKPELSIDIDRDKAADLGISARDVAAALQILFGGSDLANFKSKGEEYEVIVQLDRESRSLPADVDDVYLRSRGGELVQLSNLISMREAVAPSEINHYNRLRAVTLQANPAPGVTLEEAATAMENLAKEVLPPSFTTSWSGEVRELREGAGNLGFTFGLALLAVFMVLASQFESLIDPFTILLAVPLAVLGALITLFATGTTLNVYSVIGIVMLIGLSAKNSILLVDYANQLRDKGMPVIEATAEAGAVRLRPILMTAISTILGTLPLAIAVGAGSAGRRSLGLAVVGGMLFSTILTLFIVPAVHTLLVQAAERVGRGE